MSSKYQFLKQYVNNQDKGIRQNRFFEVSDVEVRIAEARLGFTLPVSLKKFWKEIGYGFLVKSEFLTEEHYLINRIMSPTQVADLILLREGSGLILPDVPMIEVAIPFFEIADLQDFLVMIPDSAYQEAIYDQLGGYIERDLETFIYRLYYESPTYYLRVNDRGN